MKRFAYLGTSKDGGTYRVYESLADLLPGVGWQGDFVNESDLGPGWETGPDREIARQLIALLSRYDAVIGNVFISRRLMNVLRYLPADLPRVMVVHNVTYATYRAARVLRDHVHHTIAVSPRILSDLRRAHGFDPRRTTLVFNAVPDDLFAMPLGEAGSGPLPILSLGRLEERAKRITLIPHVVSALPRGDYRLTIAGDGPDETPLRASLDRCGVAAHLVGRVPRDGLAEVYAAHEVFLFPSRFEGMGIALAEAMAAGLVPIAARIRGVTDVIVEDGVSGMLFDQGDVEAARRHLRALHAAPALRLEMRRAARARAEALFRSDVMMTAYGHILDGVVEAPPRIAPTRPVERWATPLGLGAGLRSLLPARLRQRLADIVFHR